MRTFWIGLGGGTATAGTYGLHKINAGAVGDMLWFVAIVGLVLTVGVVAASAIAAWQERDHPPRVFPDPATPSRRRFFAVGKARCGSCRRRMTQLGPIWICALCDSVAAAPEARRA